MHLPQAFVRCSSALVVALVIAPAPPAASAARVEVKDRQGKVIRSSDGSGAQREIPPSLDARAAAAPVAVVPLADLPGGPGPTPLAPVGGSDTWPMFQADARHTGYLPIDLDPTQFAFRWQQDIGGTYPLNPVTAGDGKVFVSLVTYFNQVPAFFALDAGDGHTLWSKNFGDIFSVNPPSYAYGKVYVQTGNHGNDTWLRAYDAVTGTLAFQAPHQAQWERYFAPTIHDGKVYVDGGYYGGMYAFDALNGARLWFDGTLPQYDQWTPAVDDTRAYAYLGEYQPGLYVRARPTGAPAAFIPDANFDWNGWSMQLAPVLGDANDVFAIHDGRLLAFDTISNSIRFELVGPFTGQPSYHAGRIYAVKTGRLVVLDEMTGAEIWAWTPPIGQIVGPMIVTRTHVLASTAQQVYAVSLATHQDVWSYAASGHLAMADDTLYIASADGMLRAIAAPGARLSAAALSVDPAAGTGSDGNGVLEAGETVTVAPSWLNGYAAAQAFTGAATSFAGPGAPGNPFYTIADSTASYGTVNGGATGSCLATADCYAVGLTIPSIRPATHWDARLDEEIAPQSLAAVKAWTVHVGESFFDVPRSSPYYRFVETLLHRNVTGGCTSTAYCPAAATTREQMAVFVLVAKEGSGYAPPACGTPMFSDVPASSPFCRWIEELARRGVAGGCGANMYCPTAHVSREEMAVFVLATKEPGVTPPACGAPIFSDVPASSPFCRWVEELARRGVVSGCCGGAYCPSAAVTREQMGVFLSVTFGLQLYGP
jgi:outer membrane protein assembly factor BamB